MTRDVGELDIGIVSHPAVPVAQADAGGPNLDNDAIVLGVDDKHLPGGVSFERLERKM